ncbi:sugar nucleotide-binding protein [Nocardia asteroides NBRC 15531]|uniref:dTDP-4-dehydrorhamnose reductase n=1 Tax=Nocardia asteroides NBRC 15531 TaxID=1110697 RepID=U5ENG1_NOCAS|nr:sugar nucleotide-binding protein [Nocardia asteroides]TLF66895.1 sugar nucleotide-binding protein [Nocardia asteroides NBRC 15531]UGT51856.1 sugar nucleotide-binding protein [Nocardia asteroides]SFM15208.1 dTDP-4-dehydrorhamnose reductase [Nocardia asteroides]VEG35232.1 dTDP-4-dehydrorhamnose reductase [Nocardia asteroides]GAD86614.1 dTDP-4-dehydrorhamnose reductase [Nocardia asteroides NBRC 15531]
MRILILGASGFVGSALHAQLGATHEVVGTGRGGGAGLVALDLADAAAVRALVADRADVVIHAAGLVDLAAAQRDPDAAYAANVAPMPALLDTVDDAGAKLVYLSTDNVFDGTRDSYDETALRTPINVYGCTKASAEHLVLARAGHLVVRLPLVYGRSPRSDKFLARFTAPTVEARTDIVGTPLYLPSLAPLLTQLFEESGVVHVAGAQVASRYELMTRVRDRLGARTQVVPTDQESAPPDCPRPQRLILRSVRHPLTGPDIETALDDLIGHA